MKQVKLKAELILNKVTLNELAKILNISYVSLNKKINGKTKFSLQEAFIISYILDKQIEDIFLHEKFTKKVLSFKKE